MHRVHAGATTEGGEHPPHPIIRGLAREVARDERGRVAEVDPRRVFGEQTLALHLERAQRLEQRRLEGPVDGHDLAGRLHLRAEPPIGGPELVERPARDLHHDVVEGRLERRGRPPRDRVRDLPEAFPDGDLCGHPRDRIPGGFGRERRRA